MTTKIISSARKWLIKNVFVPRGNFFLHSNESRTIPHCWAFQVFWRPCWSNWAEIRVVTGGMSLESCLQNPWLQKESADDWEQAGCRWGSHWSYITLFWLVRPGNLTFTRVKFLFSWPWLCSSHSFPLPALVIPCHFPGTSPVFLLLFCLFLLRVPTLLLGWAPRCHLILRSPSVEWFPFPLVCQLSLNEAIEDMEHQRKNAKCMLTKYKWQKTLECDRFKAWDPEQGT